MMRDQKILRRRGVAIAALTIALCVGVPELAAPAGATSAPTTGRSETTEQQVAIELTAARPNQTQPGANARRRRNLRRAARAKRQKKRRAAARRRKAARNKRAAKRKRNAKKRRNALAAKRAKNRRQRNAAAAKKANKKSMGFVDWAEVLFFVLLPFLAVAAFLFGTDYQRKPRAPSRHGRKRSLVITPVSRKF